MGEARAGPEARPHWSLDIGHWTLIAGVLAGFTAAALLGRSAEGYSKPSNFARFHEDIAPEGTFFPTFSMMENLALARWAPGRTVVIVAGNSILNGYGQSDAHLWSRQLQTLLGERYAVVNLSFRGALPTEGGALVAESLIKRGVPAILVTNTSPGTVGRPAGNTYGYLYWDALYKGKLLDHALREQDIADWVATLDPAGRAREAEARRAGRLDNIFHFQALWHHVAYRHFFAVWNARHPAESWRPRDAWPDAATDLPPLPGHPPEDIAHEVETVRGFSVNLAEPDPVAGWKLLKAPRRIADDLIEHMLPVEVQARTVVLLTQNAPLFRAQLTPSERKRDEAVFAGYVQTWKWHGIDTHEVGADFEDADYVDRSHLSAAGGAKLAQLTAGYVLALDRR